MAPLFWAHLVLYIGGPIYKTSYDLSQGYFKFIVRSTYDSDLQRASISLRNIVSYLRKLGGSVAEWLACRTQVQKARVQIAVATLSGNSLRQTAHTHCASVHQAAKLVAALLRVAEVTAGLAESNDSLPPGL